MNILSVYGIAVYIVILFALSAFFVKKALNSFEEYSLCGRSLSFVYIVFTYLGTWIGGGTIIGLSSSSYVNGVGQYWVFAVPYITGYLFAFLFITRIRALKQHSIGDMLALRYPDFDEFIRIPATVGIIIRNVTMIGMQFSALSLLITYAFQIDRNLAVLMTFLVITAYTALSGLWGVVATDIFQGFLQTAGLLLLLYFAVKLGGGMDGIGEFYQSIGKENYLNLIGQQNWLQQIIGYFLTFGMFFLMSDQSDWERIYSSKSDKTAFWGFLVPLTVTLIILLIPAYLGVFQRVLLVSDVNSSYGVYSLIMEVLSPQVAVFILISIFAAIMSSADSYMLASGVTFSNDIVKRFLNKNANDREMIFWTRLFIIISGAIGFAFALNIEDIIFLWLTGIGIGATIVLPAYLFAWFSKTVNTMGALAGMAAGTLYCSLWVIGVVEFDIYKIFYGLLLNAAVTLSVSFVTEKPEPETILGTYYWAPRFGTVTNIPK